MITVGAIIDGLQAGVGIALAMVFFGVSIVAPVTGAVVGGVAGCLVGGLGGAAAGTLAAVVGAIPGAAAGCAAGTAAGTAAGSVVGSGVAASSGPMGMLLGYVFDFCIGIGGGTLLVILLVYNKMFYAGSTLVTYIGEALPIINMGPGWTALAVRCTYKKYAEEKEASIATHNSGQLYEAIT